MKLEKILIVIMAVSCLIGVSHFYNVGRMKGIYNDYEFRKNNIKCAVKHEERRLFPNIYKLYIGSEIEPTGKTITDDGKSIRVNKFSYEVK